jgi:simple sugar transport system permease protein
MGALGLFALIVFAILPKEGQPVTYSFVLGDEWILIKEWIVNSTSASLGFAIASLLAVALAAIQFRAGKKHERLIWKVFQSLRLLINRREAYQTQKSHFQ